LAVALFVPCGCKNRGGGGGLTRNPEPRYDPLVKGPYIPRQHLPLTERDGTASRDPRDPLTRTTGRSDRATEGYSSGPERFRGTYVPSPDTSPAALASGIRDGNELKIADTRPDDRVPLRPAGGPVSDAPPPAAEKPRDDSLAPLFADLQKYGAKQSEWSMTQENGQFLFRASVPLPSGARRQYAGIGHTREEAIRQVLDQIVGDRK
jgi:hypothetical protein